MPKEHVASNGNRQFTILVKAKSKRAVVELLGGGMTLHHLTGFCGCHVAPEELGFNKRRKVSDIVQEPSVIYYEHQQDWFKYTPEQ